MKKLYVFLLAAFALVLLAGCQPKKDPTVPSSGEPTPGETTKPVTKPSETKPEPTETEPGPTETDPSGTEPFLEIYSVEFVVDVPEGTHFVFMVGAFNGWNADNAVELEKGSDGKWRITLDLEEGEQEYKYLSGQGWAYVEKDADGEEMDNRVAVVTDELEVVEESVAQWASLYVPPMISITFDSYGGSPVANIDAFEGAVVDAPADPTKEGFRFGGWHRSKKGAFWTDPLAHDFSKPQRENLTLYASWEPLNPKTHNWDEGSTYTSAMSSAGRTILNPFTYEFNHEDNFMGLMSTALYYTEIDWDLAVSQGVGDFVGDFSKIIAGEYSIDSFELTYKLEGATRFPIDSEGNDHLVDGVYNPALAAQITDTKWTFHLRDDIYFQDGRIVDSGVWEFAIKQFLDKDQLNFRSNIYYKTEDNENGYPILNGYEYFKGNIEWDQVGFKIIDQFTFEVEFFEPVSQATALGFGGTTLVHPEVYAASLNAEHHSTYGTEDTPFVSYGGYVLKSFEPTQKIVFNKNFDYVLKHLYNYKSQVYTIVDNEIQRKELFENGELSHLSLTKDIYKDFAEDPRVYRSYDGFPENIQINLAESLITGEGKHEHATIMFDKRFRQALFFGFNTIDFTSQVNAPNAPAMTAFPAVSRLVARSPIAYIESSYHKNVLDDLNIDEDTFGFQPALAVQLFNAAYDEWIAEGNVGPVVLKYVAAPSIYTDPFHPYIKEHYETLFGVDKLEIDVQMMERAAYNVQVANWNFDLIYGTIGFGRNTSALRDGALLMFGGVIAGGGGLGLTHPYDQGAHPDNDRGPVEDGFNKYGDYWFIDIEVSLPAMHDYLSNMDEESLNQYQAAMLENLNDNDGVYKSTIGKAISLVMTSGNPFGLFNQLTEPYEGATAEAYALLSEFERVYLDHITSIPAATGASAVIYADNVVITWPKYSLVYGWGAARYRYLSTDPDFQ